MRSKHSTVQTRLRSRWKQAKSCCKRLGWCHRSSSSSTQAIVGGDRNTSEEGEYLYWSENAGGKVIDRERDQETFYTSIRQTPQGSGFREASPERQPRTTVEEDTDSTSRSHPCSKPGPRKPPTPNHQQSSSPRYLRWILRLFPRNWKDKLHSALKEDVGIYKVGPLSQYQCGSLDLTDSGLTSTMENQTYPDANDMTEEDITVVFRRQEILERQRQIDDDLSRNFLHLARCASRGESEFPGFEAAVGRVGEQFVCLHDNCAIEVHVPPVLELGIDQYDEVRGRRGEVAVAVEFRKRGGRKRRNMHCSFGERIQWMETILEGEVED